MRLQYSRMISSIVDFPVPMSPHSHRPLSGSYLPSSIRHHRTISLRIGFISSEIWYLGHTCFATATNSSFSAGVTSLETAIRRDFSSD